MIKKINISLIIISSLITIYFVITRDKGIAYILKDISILLTMPAIYIVQKLFKIKINEGLNFIYIIFIFISHFLGVICELYNNIYWFDKFAHFLSGVLTSFLAIYLLIKMKNKNSLVFNILFIICFSLAIAAFWEIFEYLSSYYLNVDPQKVKITGVTDTMGDIIVAFLGSILVSVCYYFEHTQNYNLLVNKFEKLV